VITCSVPSQVVTSPTQCLIVRSRESSNPTPRSFASGPGTVRAHLGDSLCFTRCSTVKKRRAVSSHNFSGPGGSSVRHMEHSCFTPNKRSPSTHAGLNTSPHANDNAVARLSGSNYIEQSSTSAAKGARGGAAACAAFWVRCSGGTTHLHLHVGCKKSEHVKTQFSAS
jgi:hypothetical protein